MRFIKGTVAAYFDYCSVRYSFMARIKLCKNPPTVLQINPPIVLTFTRQRCSGTTFSLSLALLLSRSNIHPHTTLLLFLYSQQYQSNLPTTWHLTLAGGGGRGGEGDDGVRRGRGSQVDKQFSLRRYFNHTAQRLLLDCYINKTSL
jgi:hypothetical protein